MSAACSRWRAPADPDSAGSQFFICLAPCHSPRSSIHRLRQIDQRRRCAEKIGDTGNVIGRRRKEQADKTHRDRKHQDRPGRFGEVSRSYRARRSFRAKSRNLRHPRSDDDVVDSARHGRTSRIDNDQSPSSRCGAAPSRRKISRRAVEFIREAAGQGAQIVCLPELFRSQYFCQIGRSRQLRAGRRDSRTIDIGSLGEARRELKCRHYRVAFRETQRRRLSQHRRHHRRGWKTARASIARCTSRTIRFITKSFISRRAISGFKAWPKRSAERSASAFAGINGIRKRRV